MEANIIHCGECAEVMRDNIPDNAIDLTVTSPPYDNLREYQGYEFDFETTAAELWRVTKPGGVVVWVVADQTINGSETGTIFRQALCFMELGFNLHQTMYCQKPNGPPPDNTRYEKVIEYMFVFSKGKPKTINLIKDKVNTWNKLRKNRVTTREKDGTLRSRGPYTITKFGKRLNVWSYATGDKCSSKDKTDHPAIFPETLAHDHIISWSNPGDVVLDPFVGSGTTAKMAILTGRRYIGIDISEEYCQQARERVAKVEAQPMLIPFEAEKSEQSTMFD